MGSFSSKETPPEGPSGRSRDLDSCRTLVPAFDPVAFARDADLELRELREPVQETTLARARRLHLRGEHEETLWALAPLLECAPQHPEGTRLAAAARVALEGEYVAVLGSTSAILVPAVSARHLKACGLDPVSAFLLSRLDGVARVDEILDVCVVPRLKALRLLRELVVRGIVVPV